MTNNKDDEEIIIVEEIPQNIDAKEADENGQLLISEDDFDEEAYLDDEFEEYDEFDEFEEYDEFDEFEEYDEPLGETCVKEKTHKLSMFFKLMAAATVLFLCAGLVFKTFRSMDFVSNNTEEEIDKETLSSAAELILASSGAESDNIEKILKAEVQRQEAAWVAALFEDENETSKEKISVDVSLVSVLKDLKIKIVNDSNKLIPNVKFEVEVKDPTGKVSSFADDNKDGIIYLENLSKGDYSVKIASAAGYEDKYQWQSESKSIYVKESLEYKKIDVSNEIKSESQINVAKEDTKAKNQTETPTNADTVKFVSSSKTLISNEDGYALISDRKEVCSVGSEDVSSNDPSPLLDKSGNRVYLYDETQKKYIPAAVSDYFKDNRLYLLAGTLYKYTGWQTIDGATYFFDEDGHKITGEHIILGAKYNFDSTGKLMANTGKMGIDVSKWNDEIDWSQVAASGVSYAIIRCGFRGSTEGGLIVDSMFEKNIKGAINNGIKVGVYFFTQAVNEVEAIEEASMVLDMVKGYTISYPIFIDVESSNGGRADSLNASERSKICKAFAETIKSAGYTAGIYSNKSWFEEKVNATELTAYKIWLAQYASQATYSKTRIDLWQYTDSGSISGITTKVDMNISYMGY